MTTQTYRLKIARSNSLKLKMQSKFPADVRVESFLSLTKENGVYSFGVDYSKMTPGPVSDPATAYVAIEDKTAGVYREVSLSSLLTSGLDADLQAIAALTGAGVLARTADDTWTLRAVTGTANEITVADGDGVSGNPTVSLPAALTFTGKTVTGGTFDGLTITTSTFNGNAWTAGTGTLTIAAGKTLTASDTATVSGTNTGDQTITLTGDVTGTGTGSFAATIGATKVTSAMLNADVFSTAHTWSGQQTFVAPVLGTPASGVATNLTGTASGLTAGNVTTNANLTGDVTSVGNATTIGATKVTSAMLNADVFSSIHTWSGVQTFSAAPIVPTQSPSDNSTKAASTAYVDAAVTGATAGVSSLNGQTGALALMVQPQGRLTLTTGTAVMATSQAAKSTVYFTPTGGNQCPIYDGTNFIPTTFTELSQATTDATKSPAAVANNSNYDIFVWNDGGTIRATRGPAWTSSTARGTGAGTTELDFTTAFPTNKNAITNGPAANRGTYVGTIRSNGTATIDWIWGGSSTAAVFGVWNNYNRVHVATTVYESNVTWTYSSATTRQVRGSSTNQVSFVSGLAEEAIDASYQVAFNTGAASGASLSAGLALDSTTTFDKRGVTTNNSSTLLGANIGVRMAYAPQIGYHYISANEAGDGTNTTTFVGTDRNALVVSTFM